MNQTPGKGEILHVQTEMPQTPHLPRPGWGSFPAPTNEYSKCLSVFGYMIGLMTCDSLINASIVVVCSTVTVLVD